MNLDALWSSICTTQARIIASIVLYLVTTGCAGDSSSACKAGKALEDLTERESVNQTVDDKSIFYENDPNKLIPLLGLSDPYSVRNVLNSLGRVRTNFVSELLQELWEGRCITQLRMVDGIIANRAVRLKIAQALVERGSRDSAYIRYI